MKGFTKSFFIGFVLAWVVGWSTHAVGCAYDAPKGAKAQSANESPRPAATTASNDSGYGSRTVNTADNGRGTFSQNFFGNVGKAESETGRSPGSWKR